METLIKTITENPITWGIIASALAAVFAFFKPIMLAVQAALIRKIDRAWSDSAGEFSHDARVRVAADRVRSSTLVPLPRAFLEKRIREHKSEHPPPP